jgi:hypothetical protein
MMRSGRSTRRVTPEGLRSIIQRELMELRRISVGRSLNESAGASIDWNSESGAAIEDAIQGLTFAIIEHFVGGDDPGETDSYVSEVHNDIVAAVEKMVGKYSWS